MLPDQGIQVLNSTWAALGSIDNPAANGVALWDAGYRTSGLYYITTSNGGTKQVYVDLTTTDAETNKAGWMLAGSWSTASRWSLSATTTSSVLGTTAVNAFSNSFGTTSMQFMRAQVSSSITSTGASATSADFYFYWSAAANWRTRWVSDSSNSIYTSSTVNHVNPISRDAMQSFTKAYNLKFAYSVNQNWNNLSDNPGRQGDWWNGLAGTATAIGWNGANDGSFAILPQGSSYTGAGQDCNSNQTKFGSDDTASVGATPNVSYYGTSGTSDMNANTGSLGSDTNLWLWIK
jgi:hypothetical protein